MIHESAIIDGPVVVEPGASIGPGACIEGPAYVGLLRSLGVEASYL
jgi:UDP-3-O-[3-hydroxymyristoyl] glucosamine N-acyltransferase